MIKKYVWILLIIFGVCSANAKKIGIELGQKAPEILTKDVQGKKFELSSEKNPVVLIFYRGGWCPYCNLQLRKLEANVVPKLKKYKAKLVAISVDKVSEAVKTLESQKLNMTVISDSDANIVKAYNLVNKVPQKMVNKYKNDYQIDLEASSGKKHHIIPIPAVYVISKGIVKFAYANEDYKVRAQEKDILAALGKL